MRELTAQLNLYGAIDEAVRDAGPGDTDAARRAAEILPQYAWDLDRRARPRGSGQTCGWFSALRELVGEDVLPRQDVSDALDVLAGADPQTPAEAGQRLEALWATAQFFDEDVAPHSCLCGAAEKLVGPNDPEAIVAALRDVRSRTCGGWHHELRKGAGGKVVPLISQPIAEAEPACDAQPMYFDVETGGVRETEVGVVLTSEFTVSTNGRKLGAVTRFTDPVNWPECFGSFWCEMKHLEEVSAAAGHQVYEEVVGDCPDTPWFTTCLKFDEKWTTDSGEATANKDEASMVTVVYDLVPHPCGHSDGKIRVDKGRIVVRYEDNGSDAKFHVRTVKGLLLSPAMGTGGLGIAACAMGWGRVGTKMFQDCTAGGDANSE